jgi:hypothetical protein
VDPTAINAEKYPLATHASVLNVTLEAGETLYLPSLWYHQVAQPGVVASGHEPGVVASGHESGAESHRNTDGEVTIAVNAWYNMSFLGQGWAHYQLARSLSLLIS